MLFNLMGVTCDQFKLINKIDEINSNSIQPIFNKEINKIDDNHYELKLQFLLKDSPNYKAPLDIDLIMKGMFAFKDVNEDEVIKFLNTNGIQILFPFLRSMLSSAMSALMIPPLFIPLMDSRKIFK